MLFWPIQLLVSVRIFESLVTIYIKTVETLLKLTVPPFALITLTLGYSFNLSPK